MVSLPFSSLASQAGGCCPNILRGRRREFASPLGSGEMRAVNQTRTHKVVRGAICKDSEERTGHTGPESRVLFRPGGRKELFPSLSDDPS